MAKENESLKTIKLKSATYAKLIKAKAKLEFGRGELYSFDGLIDHLLEELSSSEFVARDTIMKI